MKFTTFIALTLLACACSRQSEKTSGTGTDTLVINNKVYYLDSIPESVYNSVAYVFPAGSDTVARDTSVVSISIGRLVVKSAHKPVVFRNDTSDTDTTARYEYKHTYGQLGFVHIQGLFYEWSSEFLINLKSGTKSEFWQAPLFSPGHKLVLSYSADLEGEMMANGIQLYKLENGEIVKVFERELDKWEPEEIRWESDTSIVIRRAKLDSLDNKHIDFVRMKLKD